MDNSTKVAEFLANGRVEKVSEGKKGTSQQTHANYLLWENAAENEAQEHFENSSIFSQ